MISEYVKIFSYYIKINRSTVSQKVFSGEAKKIKIKNEKKPQRITKKPSSPGAVNSVEPPYL